MLAEHSDKITGAIRAIARGWGAAHENPEAAVDALVERYPNLDRDAEMAASPLVLGFSFNEKTAAGGWGDMSAENWQAHIDTYDNLDQMDPEQVWGSNMDALGDVKPEDIETNSFTTTTFDYYVQAEDQIPGDYKYALVNYAKPTDLAAFIQENRELWKPLHKASIENILNKMTYWGMSSVIYPAGHHALFSVYTVDGFNSLNDALDYLRFTETADNSPNAAAWNDVIDKTNMDELTPNGFERRIIYERVMLINE